MATTTNEVKTQTVISTKLQKATDAESARYALGNVQVTPAAAAGCGVWQAATDARIAAVVFDEDSQSAADAETLIPADALPGNAKAEYDATLQQQPDESWERTKTTKAGITKTTVPAVPRDEETGQLPIFPRIDQVLPEIDGGSLVLTIDARRLLNLVEALRDVDGPADDAGMVSLIIPQDSVNCRDDCIEGCLAVVAEDGRIGAIMPCGDGDNKSIRQRYMETRRGFQQARQSIGG